MDIEALVTMLTADEAKRQFPYDDATGKPLRKGDKVQGQITIGIGRNLSGNGLSEEEIYYLLHNDIRDVVKSLDLNIPWWCNLTAARQQVLVCMAFNMGVAGLMGFKTTLSLIQKGHYREAASQMLKSKWATQVGDGLGGKLDRAERLAKMMAEG